MLDSGMLTAPVTLSASCAECEEHSVFNLSDSDVTEGAALYQCAECGHVIRLELDP